MRFVGSLVKRASFVAVVAATVSCAGAPVDSSFSAQRSLIEIVAEVESARDADLYRFDPPRDVTGENLFRASLARLDRFEALSPDPELRPAILLARATARERMLDFEGAVETYREVAATSSALAVKAKERTVFAEEMERLSAPLRESAAPLDLLAAIDAQRLALVEFRARVGDDPRRCLVECAIERLDVRHREFSWRFRAIVPDGTARFLEAAERTARDHAESRRVLEHLLRLGDAYAELARSQFAAIDPHDHAFDAARARNLIRAAEQVYAEVAAVDGRIEREEARAALASLEALGQRLRAADDSWHQTPAR